MTNRDELLDQRTQLIAYCQSKLKAGDWHAVQDAASDIRELDAKLEVIVEFLGPIQTVAASAAASANELFAKRLSQPGCFIGG